MGELLTTPTETSARRRRSDGERSRAAILDAATRLATVQGLDGLSIGLLAEHIGMSKSGLYAHFGSKEELQLATIDAASEIFVREVIEPARAAEGAARLDALSDSFLSYLERRVFPGGCFFAAAQAELDTHPGPVREKLREASGRWLDYVERQVRGAQEMGELRADEDPAQLAFEIDAMLKMATAVFVLHDDASALERARRGVGTRVAHAKIAA
jgi:AcrR family transcriptional regulator